VAILGMIGFDEEFGFEYDGIDVGVGAGGLLYDTATRYRGEGFSLRRAGYSGWTRAGDVGRQVVMPLDHVSSRLVIGGMLAPGSSTELAQNCLGLFVRKGAASISLRRDFVTSGTIRMVSSGLDGTDFDEGIVVGTSHTDWGTGASTDDTSGASAWLHWRDWALVVDDLGAGGTRLTWIVGGEVKAARTFPDAEIPAGPWTSAEWHVYAYATGTTGYTRVDDLYVDDARARPFAKVRTLRPDVQGFHDDWADYGGASTKVEATADSNLATGIGTATADDRDTVEVDAIAPLTGLDAIVAVQHTVIGDVVDLEVKSSVREGSTDYDAADPFDLDSVPGIAWTVWDDRPSGGQWTQAAVADAEFGLLAEAP
jgi:hypothetical protein